MKFTIKIDGRSIGSIEVKLDDDRLEVVEATAETESDFIGVKFGELFDVVPRAAGLSIERAD